jgi:peptidoglycan/xylan/chitin deacetylase (PgdA/CDA1 family)
MPLIRKIVKHGLAVLVYYTGLLAFFIFINRMFRSRADVIILMYHRVLNDPNDDKEYTQAGMAVSRQFFDDQMAYLAGNYNFLSLESAVEILQNKRPLPRSSVIITFDDGWRDNYLHAYPILKKYNVPATIFLATDYIDTGKIFWFLQVGLILTDSILPWDKLVDIFEKVRRENKNSPSAKRLSRRDIDSIKGDYDKLIEKLKELDNRVVEKIIDLMIKESGLYLDKGISKRWMLNWDEITEMSKDNIDFGSHSQSHRNLTSLRTDEVRSELAESKRIIEHRIRNRVSVFCYPYGDYNDEVRHLARKAGYDCAVTTRQYEKSTRKSDVFALDRVGVHDGMSVGPGGKFSKAMFACHLRRLF